MAAMPLSLCMAFAALALHKNSHHVSLASLQHCSSSHQCPLRERQGWCQTRSGQIPWALHSPIDTPNLSNYSGVLGCCTGLVWRPICVQVETAEVQLDVIEEGIDELCSLESYMQRTHPPDESAQLLAVICCPRREIASIHACIHPYICTSSSTWSYHILYGPLQMKRFPKVGGCFCMTFILYLKGAACVHTFQFL